MRGEATKVRVELPVEESAGDIVRAPQCQSCLPGTGWTVDGHHDRSSWGLIGDELGKVSELPIAANKARRCGRQLGGPSYAVLGRQVFGDEGTAAAFIHSPLPFCLQCQAAHEQPGSQAFRKLAKLSAEGRSSAVSIISASVVSSLREIGAGLDDEAKKLLAFVAADQRQSRRRQRLRP